MITQRYYPALGEWFHHDTSEEANRERAYNLFMATNEGFIMEAAEQHYLAEIHAGRMEAKENWHEPLFESTLEVIERLGIKDRVMAHLEAQFEIEYEFQQHQEMLKAVMDEEARLNLIPPFNKKAWLS